MSFAVHSLQSRVVDQSGVDVNLADYVAGCSIGNHDLLRGYARKNDQEQDEEEDKPAWSLTTSRRQTRHRCRNTNTVWHVDGGPHDKRGEWKLT